MPNIKQTYLDDISNYCNINNIGDIELFINQCLKQGFDIKKYGFLGETDEKVIEKEIIVEKRVEVPIEVIKEVEKVIEVPVEVKVIEYVDREVVKEVTIEVPKEKIVTKIEYISDKTGEDELLLKIQQLESELSKKDENLDELRRKLDVVVDEKPVIDNSKQKMLESTLQNLRRELMDKNKLIEELTQKNKLMESQLNPVNAVYLKGSNLNERI